MLRLNVEVFGNELKRCLSRYELSSIYKLGNVRRDYSRRTGAFFRFMGANGFTAKYGSQTYYGNCPTFAQAVCMNYLPFVGFWFYGGADSTERANYFASWGLLDDLPDYSGPSFVKRVWDWFWEFF